jgi:hypothetical protein
MSDGGIGMTDNDQTVLQDNRTLSAGSACGFVSSSTTDLHGWPNFLGKSLWCQSLLAEYEEILKHKWNESEKAGHDIGLDYALMDWVVKHRSKWRKSRQCQRR